MEDSRPALSDALDLAKSCARIILENGGETYRAEETVYRICTALGYEDTDVIAIPTGVFITVCSDGGNTGTAVKRIRTRTVNLEAIDAVNDISRGLYEHRMTAKEACARVREIRALLARRATRREKLISIFAAGMSSAFFSLLFGGSARDFIASMLCGMAVQLAASSIRIDDTFNFAISILGGVIIGVGSIACVSLLGGNLDKIITGAMMPLLPGIAMTNAIRDTMRGDLLSGVARAAEALLVAIAIAFGVGVVLRLYYAL
jgi:uncharacterized membrane protein YjjP (DUF1212 family)